MSLIALPAKFKLRAFSLRLSTVQRATSSPFGGSEQVIDLLNDRWLISLSLPNKLHADAASVEAFIASFRGMTNTVLLYHFKRPKPRGNMRGSPTLFAGAAKGAAGLSLQSVAGATLLAGDMIGVDGLLLQVAADAVANGSGVMPVSIVNRLRRSLSGGASVVWDRPTAVFRLSSQSAVQYIPGYSPEVPLEFVEAI